VAGACRRPMRPLSCLTSLHSASGRPRAGPDPASRRPSLRTTPSRRRLHPHTSVYYFCASINRAACVVGRLRLCVAECVPDLRIVDPVRGSGVSHATAGGSQRSPPWARASQAQLKYINCIARAASGPPRRLPPQRARIRAPDPAARTPGRTRRAGRAPGGPQPAPAAHRARLRARTVVLRAPPRRGTPGCGCGAVARPVVAAGSGQAGRTGAPAGAPSPQGGAGLRVHLVACQRPLFYTHLDPAQLHESGAAGATWEKRIQLSTAVVKRSIEDVQT
jgi:hypothetical protein